MIEPIWIENAENETLLLRWSDTEPVGAFYNVLIDGVIVATTADMQMILSGLKPGVQYRIDVAQARPDAGDMMAFWTPGRGTRLLLSVPASDAYAYRFYQDGVMLAEQVGSNGNTFLTDELTEGVTHAFRVSLMDRVGNETIGAEVNASVDAYPEGPTASGLAYASWVATISATAAGSPAGYRLYSNYLDGLGLQGALVLSRPMAFSATPNFTTWTLSPGQWLFAIRAVDASGLESDFEQLTLNIDTGGSQIADKPAKITSWDAVAGPGGVVVVSAALSTAGAVVSLGGVVLATLVSVDLPWTSADLGNATYDVTIQALESGVLSDASEPITVTTDNIAPTGSTTLTVEYVK